MNAEIRVYPSKEIDDLDFAELMDAALLRDGTLQGCGLSLNTTTHEVEIASGRMVIKGRLAVVTAGQIARPEGITTKQTCYITAACDLTAENPFTIQMLKGGDHTALVNRAANYSETTFNISNGVWIYEMATVKVDPSVGVIELTPIATDQRSGKNRMAISSSVQKDLNSQVALENEHWEKHELWRQQFARRWHMRSNFATKLINADGLNLPANTSGTFVFRKEYDGVLHIFTPSGTGADTIPYIPGPSIVLDKRYAYNGRSTGTNPGIMADTDPAEVTPSQQYDSKYHIPINVNDKKVHFGIVGVQIDNATKNGAGAANCVLQSYYTDSKHVIIKIRNTGSTAAVLKISVRSLYIVDPDF